MKSAFSVLAVVVGILVAGFTGSATAGPGQIIYSSYNPEEGPALFVHNTATETRYQISEPIDQDRNLDSFVLDAKAKMLAYRSDRDTTGVTELYTINLKTGMNTKVNPGLVAEGDVQSMAFDAKGKNLFYMADQDEDEVREIYRVDLKKNQVIQITPDATFNRMFVPDYQPLPNGTGVLYRADIETPNKFDLVLSTGINDPIRVINSSGANPMANVFWFLVDPKGKGVAYVADLAAPGVYDLYYADFKTGLSKKLSYGPNLNQAPWMAYFDATGKTLVYAAYPEQFMKFELFKADVKKGVVTKLSQPMADDRDVNNYPIDIKGKYVSYLANADSPDVSDVYRVDHKKGTIEKVSEPIADGNNYGALLDSKGNVYYIGDQNGSESFDLFVKDMKKGTTTRIDDPGLSDASVFSIQVENKGASVLYYYFDFAENEVGVIDYDMKTGSRTNILPPGESIIQFELINSTKLVLES